MDNKSLIEKSAGMPVPLLPTMVGVVTLSNVYASVLGYTWIRHICTIAAMVVWIFAAVKICIHTETFKNEYKNTVFASLYAGFTMLMMLFGAYLFPYSAMIGKSLWFAGIIIHALHILIFTYNNVLKGVKVETFVPTWFVTYNGIMVSVVVGGAMEQPLLGSILLYYGIAVYVIAAIFLIPRIATKPLNAPLLHSKAIFLAPCSLCLVSYINVVKEPNSFVVYTLYAAVLISLLYFIKNINRFFSVPFAPGFAGMTFPNAIGVVASIKMVEYLNNVGSSASEIVNQIVGIQIYLTTAVIAFVVYNFIKIFIKSYEKKEA